MTPVHSPHILCRLILCLTAWIAVAASAELGPQPPPADRLWFALLAQSPIRSGADYEHRFLVELPDALVGQVAPKLKLEMRGAEGGDMVRELNFEVFDGDPMQKMSSSGSHLSNAEVQELASIAPGKYLVAVTAAGVRCSNVCAFTVQPDLQETEIPVLELVELERAPYRELPTLGLRVRLPENAPPALFAPSLTFVPVQVDGVLRETTLMLWGGLTGPKHAGARFAVIVDLERRAPKVAAQEMHEITVTTAGIMLGPLKVGRATPLGHSWDARTAMQAQ